MLLGGDLEPVKCLGRDERAWNWQSHDFFNIKHCLFVSVLYRTSRFHVSVHLLSNRSQMKLKCGKNVSALLSSSNHILTSAVIYYWTDVQHHFSLCVILGLCRDFLEGSNMIPGWFSNRYELIRVLCFDSRSLYRVKFVPWSSASAVWCMWAIKIYSFGMTSIAWYTRTSSARMIFLTLQCDGIFDQSMVQFPTTRTQFEIR